MSHVVESELLKKLRSSIAGPDSGDDDWYWHPLVEKAIDALERLHWVPIEKADDAFYGFDEGEEFLVMCSPEDGEPFQAVATFTPAGWVVGPDRRPLSATVTHVMECPARPGE